MRTCTPSARACPPEDCGGPFAYAELLEIPDDPVHPEHDERSAWLAGIQGHGAHFDPDAFDPAAVRFTDPEERLAALRPGL